MRHLRRTGQARRRDMARTLYYLVRYKLGLLDVDRALAASLDWVRGKPEAALAADCLEWYARVVRPYVYPAMAATVEAHRRAGHVPAILTSATRYLAEPLAADLHIEHVLVTQLVVRDGRFTGEAVRPARSRGGQNYLAGRVAERPEIALRRRHFFTHSITGPA